MSISYTNSDSFLTQLIKNTEYGCIGSSFVKNQYHELGIKAIPITSCEKAFRLDISEEKKMRYQI